MACQCSTAAIKNFNMKVNFGLINFSKKINNTKCSGPWFDGAGLDSFDFMGRTYPLNILLWPTFLLIEFLIASFLIYCTFFVLLLSLKQIF